MKTLADMPKHLYINRPILHIQLGINYTYTLEVVSMRSLKRKCIEVKPDAETFVHAPSGYRIERIWRGIPSSANELPID